MHPLHRQRTQQLTEICHQHIQQLFLLYHQQRFHQHLTYTTLRAVITCHHQILSKATWIIIRPPTWVTSRHTCMDTIQETDHHRFHKIAICRAPRTRGLGILIPVWAQTSRRKYKHIPQRSSCPMGWLYRMVTVVIKWQQRPMKSRVDTKIPHIGRTPRRVRHGHYHF